MHDCTHAHTCAEQMQMGPTSNFPLLFRNRALQTTFVLKKWQIRPHPLCVCVNMPTVAEWECQNLPVSDPRMCERTFSARLKDIVNVHEILQSSTQPHINAQEILQSYTKYCINTNLSKLASVRSHANLCGDGPRLHTGVIQVTCRLPWRVQQVCVHLLVALHDGFLVTIWRLRGHQLCHILHPVLQHERNTVHHDKNFNALALKLGRYGSNIERVISEHIDGLVKERRNSVAGRWSYVFLALTHRHVIDYVYKQSLWNCSQVKATEYFW